MGKRACFFIFDGLLLSAGCVTAAVCSAVGFRMPAAFAGVANVLTVVVFVLLLAVVAIEIASVYKISDSTFHTALIAVAVTLYFFFSTDCRAFLLSINCPPPRFCLKSAPISR